MPDIVSKEKRSEMMAGIKGQNTKPEILIRKLIHSLGFRYRLHYKKLPGKPDIVLPKYKAAILINGCFWHWHNCSFFKMPSSNQDFWRNKIESNRNRDQIQIANLTSLGYKVLIIWECSLRGKNKLLLSDIGRKIENWLINDKNNSEISGT